MAKFVITAHHPVKEDTKKLIYDTEYSTLHWEDGTPISPVKTTITQTPVGQKSASLPNCGV